MKKIKYISLICLVFVLTTTACNEDFFELDVPFDSPITDTQTLDASIAGAYYNLTGSGGNGSTFANILAFSIAISDEAYFPNEANGEGNILSFYDRENVTESGWLNTVWTSAYGTIGTVNVSLDFIATNPFPGLPTRSEIPRMEGELKFIRAYAYWMLAKAFCPPYETGGANSARILPYRINAPSGLQEAVQGEPATVDEIYQLIVNDLIDAKELLPNDYTEVHEDFQELYMHGRANRFSAAALLSRVYFQMGQFDMAEAEADFVIDQNGGRHGLDENPLTTWARTWNETALTKESLWTYSIGRTPNVNGMGPGSDWKIPRRYEFYNFFSRFSTQAQQTAPLTHNNGSRTLSVSETLLSQAGWIDGDGDETDAARADKRYQELFLRVEAGNDPVFDAIDEPLVWSNRYYRFNGEGGNAGRATSHPILRIAEVYLTRAIIRFNNGDLQGAADDLNVIRERAWDEDVAGEPYTEITSGTITADKIHTERMIEMAFQGDRSHYLQALQLNIPNGDRGPGSIPYNDNSLYWPIPEREKELNTALQGQLGN